MTASGQSAVFGRRRDPHTIIIARGDRIRHFTVRPWVIGLAGAGVAAIALGYVFATTYLVLRDDLIGAAVARQARMQQAYEDRISSLRAQVDRITSRQLLDQQLMENKVTELLDRQSQLTTRHGRLGDVLDRAEAAHIKAGEPVPVPSERPVDGPRAAIEPLAFGGVVEQASVSTSPFSFWTTRDASAQTASAADNADRLFVSINKSLRDIETDQITKLDTLTDDAYQKAEAISEALNMAGLPVAKGFGKEDVGGPFVAIDSASRFDSKVKELDEALNTLDELKREVAGLPIANPAPGRSISSAFGVRKDPLLGTPALHAGMDFRAPSGAPIQAPAAGKVIRAGWNGGYGRMVEIEHKGGYTTRFAHMSRILVKEGDSIEVGTVVGEVGSSGRSTGPHLHYEVRHKGEALNPLRFLRIGKKVQDLL